MTEVERAVTPAYLWFDSEFTSLNTDEARLLQVALLPTDAALGRLAEPSRDVNLYIRLGPGATVSPWVEENLPDLVRKCRSREAVPVDEADARLAARVDEWVGPVAKDIKRRPVLAGNTVHMDLGLVRRFLPEFARRLHYRLLDVSALKILWNDWSAGDAFDKEKPGLVAQHLPAGFELPAAGAHDAFYDVHASLAELNYYRRLVIPSSPGPRRP